MRIVGLAGSLRAGSHNAALLAAAARELPADVDYVRWDGLGALPAYDPDRERELLPAAARELRAALGSADAVLVSTPEYNGSLPGALKNALDWASRPWPEHSLRERPVAVVGASTGLFGAVWAQAEARRVLKTMGARVIEAELPVGSADEAWDEEGGLRDPELRAGLRALVADLVREAEAPLELAA